MANKIQLRRDTTANWNNVNPILADGEPGLDITTNQVKYGDGANAWVDLSYASGGGGLTDVDGVVTFPGDLLIGTLWPEDPMPGGDKESVVWAKDDTEYLGLWWGGDQTYPNIGYGPVAGIMIGAYDGMTDDFTNDPSPADTNITIAINDSTGNTLEWIFDRTGNLTLPEGSTITDTASAPGFSNGQAVEIKPGGGNNDNQLLKIYPTVPSTDGNHIHITSGDLSVTDLFLGNDEQFVQIAADGNVCVGTYGTSGHFWKFGTDGNLTLPEGGTITSSGNLGNVVIQASSGTPRNFVFNTDGSITLPSLYAQGNSSIDSTNNQLSLTSSDTVDFTSFSGMVLVNCYNSGTVSMYLCGGGSGSASLIGNSKVTGTGTMAYNSGIGGYTFTATETGIHVFSSIKTRNIA